MGWVEGQVVMRVAVEDMATLAVGQRVPVRKVAVWLEAATVEDVLAVAGSAGA